MYEKTGKAIKIYSWKKQMENVSFSLHDTSFYFFWFTACYCIYEGKKYEYQEVIYNTTDGTGGCFSAVCDVNGTITRHIYICNTPTTTPPFEFSTPTTIVTGISVFLSDQWKHLCIVISAHAFHIKCWILLGK